MKSRWKNLKIEKCKLIKKTYWGWYIWHKIVKKYHLKKDNSKTAVVLMPKSDYENSYYALLYLDRMLYLRNFSSAIVLTEDSLITAAAKEMCQSLLAVERISEKESDALLQYYSLLNFDIRFLAASLTEPSGRNGKALVGVNGITVEELVAIGVYRIVPYVQKERPVYTGNDAKLKKFMDIGGPCTHKRTPLIIQ